MLRRVAKKLLIMSATVALLLSVCFGQAGASTDAHANGQAGTEYSLAIIVNESNPVNDLAFGELRKIFLGERSYWPNGRRITLVMIEPGRPERAAVLRELYHMSETDLNRHFLHGLFTGQVLVSPKTLNTPVGVCKFVFNVPGAIGYVRASDVDGSVRVIQIDGRLPRDSQYSLRLPAVAK